MLGAIVNIFTGVLRFLTTFLPPSPFQSVLDDFPEWVDTFLGWLNWFIPFGDCLIFFGEWLAALVIYTVIRYIITIVKAGKE